jgi:hypothetical protein
MKHYINGAVIHYTLDGTEPDSVSSPVYKPGVIIDTNITLKAKAFRQGWLSSNVVERHFYKRTFFPDTVMLLTQPEDRFRAKGGFTLNDNLKSDINFASAQWLGYEERRFEAVLRFKTPVTPRNITLSSLEDFSTRIFLPEKVEVWGGDTPGNLKLLGTCVPKQATEMTTRRIVPIVCEFRKTTIRYMKIIARPVPRLPKWHQDKGQKALLMIDEVFVN